MDRLFKKSNFNTNAESKFKYEDLILLDSGGIRFTKVNKIKLITAEGDYSRVWIDNDKDALMLRTLKTWETLLPEKHFIRVHRSTIINVSYIDKIEKTSSNRYLAQISGCDNPITISQRRSTQLKKKAHCHFSYYY